MYKSIMIPLADPTHEHAALKAAVRIARACGARLHVLHVRAAHAGAAQDPESSALLAVASWAADELNESVSFQSLERPAHTQPTRAVVEALQTYATAQKIDLIVMARRRHSLNRFLLGSVGEQLLLGQDAPILFMPLLERTLPARGCRILLPLDGTRGAETVLGDATELARALKGSLSLLRVLAPVLQEAGTGRAEVDAFIEEEGVYGEELAQDYLDRIAQRVRTAGVKSRWYTLPGERVSPAVRKTAAAEHAHVIALAPRTRAGSLHFAANSVTEALLQKSDTALLVRRQPPLDL